jgi:hypothetical protein
MKTIPSKLWSVVSGNQIVSGGGGDQNQSIPDFVRGYNYKTVFNSPVAFAVLEKKIFKDLASFPGFSLPVPKIIRISEPFKQIIKRPTQGSFMPKISFLGIIVSEKKIFKEMLTRTRTSCHDINYTYKINKKHNY